MTASFVNPLFGLKPDCGNFICFHQRFDDLGADFGIFYPWRADFGILTVNQHQRRKFQFAAFFGIGDQIDQDLVFLGDDVLLAADQNNCFHISLSRTFIERLSS